MLGTTAVGDTTSKTDVTARSARSRGVPMVVSISGRAKFPATLPQPPLLRAQQLHVIFHREDRLFITVYKESATLIEKKCYLFWRPTPNGALGTVAQIFSQPPPLFFFLSTTLAKCLRRRPQSGQSADFEGHKLAKTTPLLLPISLSFTLSKFHNQIATLVLHSIVVHRKNVGEFRELMECRATSYKVSMSVSHVVLVQVINCGVKTWVSQGCTMSAIFFIMVIDWEMNKTSDVAQRGQCSPWLRIWIMQMI